MGPTNDRFIEKLTKVIDKHLSDEDFNVSKLASELGMSRSTLHRKVKSTVKKSVSAFIRETRLNRAHELLIKKAGNVSEIAYQVGFSSATYFHKCFHEYFGYSPGEAASRNPVENSKIETVNTKTPGRWIIVTGLATLFIIVIIFSSVLRPAPVNKQMVRIALLPFIDSSKDVEDAIIPGIREELYKTLKHIDNLDVSSLTNSNRYKNTDKKITTISKELNVNYVLVAGGKTSANNTHIAFQLLQPTKQLPVWKTDTVINNNKDLFEFQKNIALEIIDALKGELTSEEIKQISEKPTKHNYAYKLYLLGNDYFGIWEYNKAVEALKQAKHFYQEAIKIDSSFKNPYERLGWVYHQENRLYGRDTRDSAMIMADKAISLDNNYLEAYLLKGFLYISIGRNEAEKTFKKALKFAPREPSLYCQLGNLYHEQEDYFNAVQFLLKALDYNREPIINSLILIDLTTGLSNAGYFDEAETYANVFLNQHNDSAVYFNLLQYIESLKGNFRNAINYGISALNIDSTNATTLEFLGFNYLLMNDYTNSYKYYKKYNECMREKFPMNLSYSEHKFVFSNLPHNSSTVYTTNFPVLHSVFSFMKTNDNSTEDNYFDGLIDIELKKLKNYRYPLRIFREHIELACIYSVQGDKENAIRYLNMLKKQKTGCLWLVNLLQYSPLLDNMRSEPEFTDVLNDAEAKYQKLHKQVGELLTRSDLIL